MEQPYRLTLSGSIGVAPGGSPDARTAARSSAIVRHARPVKHQTFDAMVQEDVPPVCIERPR